MSVQEKIRQRFPDTVYKPLVHPERHLGFNYTGFHPGKTQKLPRGHVRSPGSQAFPVDVTWEQDRAIPMRDGIKLYADIFRPANEHEKVPAILPWGPYGKVGTSTLNYDNMGPWHIGLPYQNLSGYETFELSHFDLDWKGPNPAEWCSRGYAIIDVDARGSGNSEGALMFWGEQLNFAARFNHPNLKAIAPWEGLTDPYGQQSCRGGIPRLGFADLIVQAFAGRGNAEYLSAMVKSRPLYDDYWDEKRIRPENIRDIPMYLTASYSTGLHCEGSFQTFERAQTARKWLRVHASQEWHDLYRPEATDDMQRFYDFYAKGIQNGWEDDTPRVRLSLLGYDGSYSGTVVERAEKQWPPVRQQTRRYYLDENSSLTRTKPSTPSQVAHEGHSLSDSSDFIVYFDRCTEVCGRPFVKLYMSCDAADDFDVLVQIRKISSSRELLKSLNWFSMPKPGPERQSDYDDEVPQYGHKSRQPIPPGAVVSLLIPIWPVGMVFEARESLMLRISGHDMALPEAEALRLTSPVDENRGRHTVYTGGEHESYIVIPAITN
ncbi:uncharacterized protein KD926_010141 [Aspergillus affinis]|uniref:uncharacterized protein n=1 Tax=Aspergillus affinis TaxID=1070780 RepID=UPI0022FE2CC1|nr:uncharacterized protein KD926_010141 [Aspergillus affinis]KAI9038927.1 hypothetical protein KD926_010141 [Aspergillus affinis]